MISSRYAGEVVEEVSESFDVFGDLLETSDLLEVVGEEFGDGVDVLQDARHLRQLRLSGSQFLRGCHADAEEEVTKE